MSENNAARKRNSNQNIEAIDLIELFKRLLVPRNVFIMLAAGLIVGTLNFVYSKYVMPEMYTSSTMVYVSNNSSVVISDGVDTQTISSNRTLAVSSVVILKSDFVMEEVGNILLETYPESELRENFSFYRSGDGKIKIKGSSIASCFSIAPIDETEVLRITAVTQNPQLSADMCNILVGVAPDFLKSVVGGGTVEAIGEAQPATQKSSPSNSKNALTGCFAAIVVVAGIFLLTILMDNKVRNSESFKSKFEFPVFVEISYIENEDTKGKKKRRRSRSLENDDSDIFDGVGGEQSFRLTETFNTLSNNISVALAMNDDKVIVVSSPDENDGKSTVSVNLARSMVKLEKKVLLIDLDLRKGALHKKN
ncbi:MAG: Wzz/FepE/Etk N-terminal domain-containing protein [Clostridiales bacterium]|nr:Wzz/FepE/Etk N-terminal domain-containing protein [Clostridiales bacterium]